MIYLNIQFPFDKYGGGGNQFLKALKKEFIKKGVYEQNPEKADVILFNSHHNFDQVFKIKAGFKDKILIHRIDGPVYLIRGRNKDLDKAIFKFNELIADGIVFQSNWSKEQNEKYLKISSKYKTIAHNASDKKIFNKNQRINFSSKRKIRLISTSNSANWKKGFEVYKFLDENLDFSKYEMTFVGNSPAQFKNIRHIERVCSEKLAKILKEHDIYITASQKDPCSNSLIEALSCGLPAIALNNGGHPELVQTGGELFNGKQDIIEKIEKIAKHYHHYQSQIPEFSIEKTTQDYYKFVQKIYDNAKDKLYNPKKVGFLTKLAFYKIKLMILKSAIKEKLC